MTGSGGCSPCGRGLFGRSLFFSMKACIPDSTVCRICCIISSGLKTTLDPCWVDEDATGVGIGVTGVVIGGSGAGGLD